MRNIYIFLGNILIGILILPMKIKRRIGAKRSAKRIRKLCLDDSIMSIYDRILEEEINKEFSKSLLKYDWKSFIQYANSKSINYWERFYDKILNKVIY